MDEVLAFMAQCMAHRLDAVEQRLIAAGLQAITKQVAHRVSPERMNLGLAGRYARARPRAASAKSGACPAHVGLMSSRKAGKGGDDVGEPNN